MLIEPVEHLLTKQHLVIVPYGPLHALPFAALFDGNQYLIDRFTIRHSPSASVFVHANGRHFTPLPDRALVLGVDDPGTPFVKEEVEAVAAALPHAQVHWGTDATERVLRSNPQGSRVIHIASHARFRPDNPRFSAIRLADSFLTLQDLYGMKLPAELLTLSGCVTGLNVVEPGDELIGLERGLLYAGARSLLLSLWEVDDRSTSEFMKAFYGAFLTTSAPEAARRAMLQIRSHRPHPYYWAAFKLTGGAIAT
jgi:CHAT domain-containing protein